MVIIKPIHSVDTYSIRHKVLRPNQTENECKYNSDEEENTFHLGAFKDDQLIGIGSFYLESHPQLPGNGQYRLRGMATLKEFRNLQAGSKLIAEAEKILCKRNANVWWCNARISASAYYEKLGLTQLGEVFEIHPIGPHKVMYKNI